MLCTPFVALITSTMIKIYTTPTCAYCKMAKDFFEENGLRFEEYNVLQDDKAREEMIRISEQRGVPVIDIDGEIYVGFNRAELQKALSFKT